MGPTIGDHDIAVAEPLRSTRLKEQDVADGANMWARVLGQLPVPLLKLASRMQFRGLMSQGNILVSNVRGPAQAFYCNGAKVHAFYPFFGVQDGLGLNVVVGFAGMLDLGTWPSLPSGPIRRR